jgi:prepilin-type processing-associated H-X9-DG protein
MKPIVCASIAITMIAVAPAIADDARVGTIARFLDSEIIAVGHLDIARVDTEKLTRQLVADQEDAGELSHAISPWLAALQNAGAKEIYLLLSLSDLLDPAQMPPPVVVPLADGADAKKIGQLLCGSGNVKGPMAWPTCATVHNAVLAGCNDALERVRQLKPVQRPELTAAVAALGETGADIVLMPTSDHRRVVQEIMPVLPKELGGGPMTLLTKGLLWVAIGLKAEPEPRLQFVVQGNDAAAAQQLYDLGKSIVQFVRHSPNVPRYAPDFAMLADELKADLNQDRISVVIDAQSARTWASVLIKPMRETAARRQCVDNLKQIGLAMHNYHSEHGSFPPAYTIDKAGKPLLSWRVHILPFLEQDALYKEFHLDEPWDSPHNRSLIERIPPPYRCPNISGKREDRSKTTYLTPRGKGTIFPGSEGVKIQKVTDGTSNTIFVIDANDDHAVIWTKPDDWEVDPPADPTAIFGHHPQGTNFSFADGSVHFIKETVAPKTLGSLVSCAGGEVISADEF